MTDKERNEMDRLPKNAMREDLWKISQFFKENYTGEGRYGTTDLFNWKAFENPTGRGFIKFIEIDDEVAFTTSITPKTLWLNNKKISSAEIGDTYKSPKHYRKDLFSIAANAARQQAEDQGIKHIYGLPNSKAFAGWLKRGNFLKQSSIHIRALSLPLDARNKLQKLIGWHGAEILVGPYRILARIFLKMKSPNIADKANYTIEECDVLPQDWSEFWTAAAEKYQFIFDRDETSFNWRYINHFDKYTFLTVRHNGTLVGYTVHKNIPTDLGYSLVLADYLFLPEHETALNLSLDRIFQGSFATSTRAISIWCEKSSPYYDIFCSRGFKDVSETPVIIYSNDIINEVSQIANAHFTIGDSDNV
ncbi:MAG: hypothetical protein JKY80_01460 [Mariprofundaceae bacterium]|nr:hypothetical protein [Mariprofundaceae bacterium]